MRASVPVRTLRTRSIALHGLGEWLEPWLYLTPSMVLLGVFIFYPLLRSVYLSLFLTDLLGRPKLYVGPQNFIDALTTPAFLHSLWVTVLFVLYTVPLGILLGLVLAILANRQVRGIKFFQLVFSSPLCISVATGSLIFMMMYNPVSGVFNYLLSVLGGSKVQWLVDPKWALFSVGLVTIWLRLGFNFVLMMSGLQNVPVELHEAARVDGANTWAQIRHITLPMLSPTIFFAAVVGVINAFQVFGEVDIMTAGGPAGATSVIVYRIYQEAFQQFQFGTASTQALLLFVVIMILTYLQFRLGERRVHYQ